MADLGREGDWIVISGDERIMRNPGERAVWIASRLTSFFLQDAWMRTTADEQAWRLLRWLPAIIDEAKTSKQGTGLSLPLKWHSGRLKRLYSPQF